MTKWVSMNFSGEMLMDKVASWCNDNNVLDFKVVQMRDGYVEIVAKVLQ